MRNRFLSPMIKIAIAATAVSAVISVSITRISAQAPAAPVLKTSWGEPDLQGIWPLNHLIAVPLQRPTQYGDKAFLSDEELAKAFAELAARFRQNGHGTAASQPPARPAAQARANGAGA